MLRRLLVTRCFVLACFHCFESSAIAQETVAASKNQQTYSKAYFDKFNPQTARDMIDRLPGFALDLGSDLRGFGGAAGNVLIDGDRPSSKSGGVEEAVNRIPASRVESIDLIRGAAGSSEAAGQTVVANIVLAEITSSGRWSAKLQHPSDGRMNAFGDLTLVRTIGRWETATKLDASIDRRPLEGTRQSRDADGALSFFQVEDRPSSASSFNISSEAKSTAAGGTLSMVGGLGSQHFEYNMVRLGFDDRRPDAFADQRFTLDFDRTIADGEVGIDWTRTNSRDWSLKLLSLSSYEARTIEQITETARPLGTATNAAVFESDRKTLETVVRSTLTRGGDSSIKPEFGVEVTYNRLDSDLSLQREDGGAVTVITLPAANVVVEETRGEAFANFIWSMTDELTMEVGVGAEASEISVSGDAVSTQDFFFIKPSAALIYDVNSGVQFRLGLRRSVGQLDFTDFAASASADDGRLTAGNPGLGPDQTTRAAFSVDLRSESRGALNAEVFHEWREDVLEQIVLPTGDLGTGNAGSARVWGIALDASIPLESVIAGGLLELEAEVLDSQFKDPITGLERDVSNTDTPSILAQFRQDFLENRVSWGVSYRAPFEGTFFFADEESFNKDGEHWAAFVETTKIKGVKATLEFSGIGAQTFLRERAFFEPDRSGQFVGSERISRDRGMFVNLTVSGQF